MASGTPALRKVPTLAPILPADLPRVAQFLHDYHNPNISIENWLTSFSHRWCPDAPNHGYMLLDGGQLVGTLAAIYSDQLIQGKTERFCNLAHWCVLGNFRGHSTRLAIALLNQKNYHFTNLTPLPVVAKTLSFLKFQLLDDHHIVIPVLPPAITFSSARVYLDEEGILLHAPPDLKKLYLDHRGVASLRQMLVGEAEAWMYLAFRNIPIKHFKGASILHSSDPRLFSRYLGTICRYMLTRLRIVAIRSDSRFLAHVPGFSAPQPFRVPTLYRSDTLKPSEIGNLYSELVALKAPELYGGDCAKPK
jgi:hypothetical protein